MDLAKYLKRAGVITGPLSSKENTSVSRAGATFGALRGIPPMPFDAKFLVYGSSLHEQFLEDKLETVISKEEQVKVDRSLVALNKNPLVKKLMAGSVTEQKLYKKIYDVLVAYILDIHNKKQRIGADLKTTSCRTLKQFAETCKKYGYFRQAHVYIKAENLKLFFFIAITKSDNPEVFILCANDYKEELKNAEEEIKWLFYFFKKYGKITQQTK